MLTWFERLSLRAKLAIGFGTLIGLMVVGGTAALIGQMRASSAVEAFLDHDDRIAAATIEYLEAIHVVRTTNVAVFAIGLFAIFGGLLVSVFIVRSANRSVSACVDFTRRLADGDWTARLPRSTGVNEFAILAAALNRMADAMAEAHGRDQAQTAELKHLNRTLRMLSRCNEALVRANNEQELLDAVCRHIVDGGYRLAWVGFVCHDKNKSIDPVAFAGADADYVTGLNLTWGDDERRRGVGGAAIRDGCPVVARAIATDAVFEPWREEALKRGFGSCIALPLKDRADAIGTLGIYSTEIDAFDNEEVRLLQELADDLAFGITGLRKATAHDRTKRALDYRTNYDFVTGLPNRSLLIDRLSQLIAHAARTDRQVAVLMLSVDRFRAVNDSLGHGAAEGLLGHVGECLRSALRSGDTVARVGSDEFAVAMGDLANAEDVTSVAIKLLGAVMSPSIFDGHEVITTASMGISLYPKDGAGVDSLLRNADAAMSMARSSGGNVFRFYAPEMNERISQRFALESDLRQALERNELQVHYQPRVNLANGELSGAEALLRWQHPERGLVLPGLFIPVAESTDLIQPIGEWVIRTVCRQQRNWLDAGLSALPIAVNLSARQFRQENLARLIRDELAAQRLESSLLEIEITESALIDEPKAALATLRDLKSIGIKLSLDDFGTGHSSLTQLRRLPIDYLKIDQTFVRNVTTDPEDAAICLAVIGLAHNLRLTVIAEGVETEGQATYLRKHRCDEMQGFFFGRPVPTAEFEQLLAQRRTLSLPAPKPEERRTLLLVDDEPSILASLKRLFRRDGYTILTAGSAQEGLELLSIHEVQVIVSDQRMPQMNGTEFLSRVRDLYPHTIRMVLSGYTELGTITDAINRGAIYKFLTKPWHDETLRKDVRDAFLFQESEYRQAALPRSYGVLQ